MSNFDFLEEMFFGRTEKSGRNYRIYCRTENAEENNAINIILEKASLNGCRIQVENLAKTIINNIKYISEYVDWYTKVDAYKDSFKTYVQ